MSSNWALPLAESEYLTCRASRPADAASASTPRRPATCRITGSSAGRSASFTSSYPADRPKTGCRKSPATECRRLWTVRVSPRGKSTISCNPGVSFNSRNSNGPPSEPIFEPWHSSRTHQPLPTFETEPDITRFACSLRVIRDPPYSPHNMLKYDMLLAVGGAKTSRYLGNVGSNDSIQMVLRLPTGLRVSASRSF